MLCLGTAAALPSIYSAAPVMSVSGKIVFLHCMCVFLPNQNLLRPIKKSAIKIDFPTCRSDVASSGNQRFNLTNSHPFMFDGVGLVSKVMGMACAASYHFCSKAFLKQQASM